MSAQPVILSTLLSADQNTHIRPQTIVRFGPFVVDVGRHEVRCRRKLIPLTASEFRILQYLAECGGYLVTRDELITAALGSPSPARARVIDVHLVAIRKKLGKYGTCIHTVRGFGYKLTRI